MDDLPKDIIFNIFSRLPIKPLFRFRCVSKTWCKLIDHPNLARMQIKQVQEDPIPITLRRRPNHRKITTCLHVVQRQPLEEWSFALRATEVPLMEIDFKCSYPSFGFCNGLIYFTVRRTSSIIVTNPLRREILKLPRINGRAATKTYGLGFDNSSNSFKMVCVLFNECTMINTLGGPRSWRKIPQVPPCPISGRPVFSRGFLYWKVDPKYADFSKTNLMIVSFDVTNEKFSFTPHPELDKNSLFVLFDMNGNLAMAKFGNNRALRAVTVWVMKDYEEKKWVWECKVPILKAQEMNSLSIDGEILVQSGNGFDIYSSTTKGLKSAHIFKKLDPHPTNVRSRSHYHYRSYPSIYSFTGSLFSLSNVMESD